jgi:uncharacterized Zn finger protein
MYYGGYGFRPYVSAAQRRKNAEKELKRRAASGAPCQPVVTEGRKLARTFWGLAWCQHLEKFSDFANRLPRGRTYVRNGAVIDLCVEPGVVNARVMGSRLYEVTIKIDSLPPKVWATVKQRCAGRIGSLVELLQGKLSNAVMDIVTQRDEGLFPSPREIEMSCSCPDYAGMCKHIAATLYGVGVRLDERPEVLFTLRQVDHSELIAGADDMIGLDANANANRRTIAADALADVFGIELDISAAEDFPVKPPPPLPPIANDKDEDEEAYDQRGRGRGRRRKARDGDETKRPQRRAGEKGGKQRAYRKS